MNHAYFNGPFGQFFDPGNCQLWTEGWNVTGINNMLPPPTAVSLFDSAFPQRMDFIPFDDSYLYPGDFQQSQQLSGQPAPTQAFHQPAEDLLTNEPPDGPDNAASTLQSGHQADISTRTQSSMLSEGRAASPKEVIKETTDRAAYLRAKIVASQKAKSATPELQHGGPKTVNKLRSNLGISTITKQEAASMVPPKSVPAMATVSEPPIPKMHNIDEVDGLHKKGQPAEPVQPAPKARCSKISAADIDALVSDVKASIETKDALDRNLADRESKDQDDTDRKSYFPTGGKPKTPARSFLPDPKKVKTEAREIKAIVKDYYDDRRARDSGRAQSPSREYLRESYRRPFLPHCSGDSYRPPPYSSYDRSPRSRDSELDYSPRRRFDLLELIPPRKPSMAENRLKPSPPSLESKPSMKPMPAKVAKYTLPKESTNLASSPVPIEQKRAIMSISTKVVRNDLQEEHAKKMPLPSFHALEGPLKALSEDNSAGPPVQRSHTPDADSPEEISEWLALSGYNDKSYRRSFLERHRKLADLSNQMELLIKQERDETLARTNFPRCGSVALSGTKLPPSPIQPVELLTTRSEERRSSKEVSSTLAPTAFNSNHVVRGNRDNDATHRRHTAYESRPVVYEDSHRPAPPVPAYPNNEPLLSRGDRNGKNVRGRDLEPRPKPRSRSRSPRCRSPTNIRRPSARLTMNYGRRPSYANLNGSH